MNNEEAESPIRIERAGSRWSLNLHCAGAPVRLGTHQTKSLAETARHALITVIAQEIDCNVKSNQEAKDKRGEYEDALLTAWIAIGDRDVDAPLTAGVAQLLWHFIARVLGQEP